jgi:hypothetical protein
LRSNALKWSVSVSIYLNSRKQQKNVKPAEGSSPSYALFNNASFVELLLQSVKRTEVLIDTTCMYRTLNLASKYYF